MNPIHWFVCWGIRLGTRVLCRIDHQQLSMVPHHGPLILVTNHIGSLEVPLLYAHLQPRKLTGLAKIETWDNHFMGWLFDLFEAIPVRRGEVDLDAFRSSLGVLGSEGILAVAPEGTRSRDGSLLRGRPGVVIMALHSGASIFPIAHWGAEKFNTNLKHLKRTDFHIRTGQPFYLNASGKKVTGKVRQEIVDEIMFQIAALLPPEYRGEYAGMDKASRKYLIFT